MKISLIVFALFFLTLASCTKEHDDAAQISDVSLNSMAMSQDGFILMRTTNPDGKGDWKIKMNDIASKAYSEGAATYPVNSMIIKERHDQAGHLAGYDVLFRTIAHGNSFEGWMLSSYSANGEVLYSDGARAANCQSCHATEKNAERI
jgi:hypothetical protein